MATMIAYSASPPRSSNGWQAELTFPLGADCDNSDVLRHTWALRLAAPGKLQAFLKEAGATEIVDDCRRRSH